MRDIPQSGHRHRVVIVGGGFGGMEAVDVLARAPVDETPGQAAVRLARRHPLATGVAAAAVVAVVKPRRLVRWSLLAVPLLWKMRRR